MTDSAAPTLPAALESSATPGANDAGPGWADGAPEAAALDVRPLLARREEPFGVIMAAAGQVPAGQVLRLRSSFEPIPLYHVLGKQGFAHWSRQLAPSDWEVLFYRTPEGEPASGRSTASGSSATPRQEWDGARADGAAPSAAEWPAAPSRTVTIDVSDLVPPEPMIRILEALEQLDPGQALLVNHVRRPVYLYARLDELGYLHETRELGPNQVELRILKPATQTAVGR